MSYAIEHEGKAYTPDGRIDTPNVQDHNKETERKEIEWLKTHPDKVFLYYQREKENQPDDLLITWLGTQVGEVISTGQRHYVGFGGAYRRSIEALIYGVRYVGWYFESSGDYCRLRKAKRQDWRKA